MSERLDKALVDRDALYDDVDAALDDLLEEWESRFLDQASRLPFQSLGDEEIIMLLALDSGLRQIGNALPLDEMAQTAENVTGGAVSERGAAALKRETQARVRQIAEKAARDIADAIRDASFLTIGLTPEKLKTILERATKKAAEAVKRGMTDAISVWDRKIHADIAQARGIDRWIYLGPLDSRNRPFCRDIVSLGDVYTAEQIEELNNHPLLHSYVPPNVRTLCGGYNCRHMWVGATPSLIDEAGL